MSEILNNALIQMQTNKVTKKGEYESKDLSKLPGSLARSR